MRKLLRTLVVATTVALLTACTKKQSEDYCDNHYLFHESHLDSIGRLDATLSNDGTVRTEFSIPISLFRAEENMDGDSIERVNEILKNPANVFRLQTEVPCIAVLTNVTSDAALLVGNYQMDCGAGAKIRQIDVVLFDVVKELDEIEALVTTPATQKRFAINRQCDSAIFRLQARSDR